MANRPPDPNRPEPLSPQDKRRRKQRNLMIALMIAIFVILVYAVTILRLGGNVAERSF